MTFGAMIDSVLLKPLQILFEIIYMTANDFLSNPGLSIIALSLLMNLLVLPLYKRADAMQEEERDMELRLHDGVAHIKKTFHGDERMMMLQTFYRQNDYKPTYVLRGAVSLFLEIPFFMAAYRFLSQLQLLEGVAFGPIADLGKPDGMLVIAGVAINLLPFIMTAVNLVSCAIFTKGSPLKSKIQLYAMAAFFLVFLYDSPAGLVFYWTLNNVFSLVKTIFYKLKNPGKVLMAMASAAGLAALVYGIDYPYPKGTLFFVALGLALQLPLVLTVLKAKLKRQPRPAEVPNKKIFFAGAIFLAILTGLLIPSAVINASPQEFVDLTYFHHPVWFIVSATCLSVGTFVVWAGVFYWLAKPAGKVLFEKAIWILCGVAIVNYMFFGKDLGLLTSSLRFENSLDFSWKSQLVNLAVLFAAAIALYLIFKLWKKHIFQILAVGSVAVCCMSVLNVVNINTSIRSIQAHPMSSLSDNTWFTLSKSGKNVVVLMLDTAMGEYIPYIMDEKPALKEQFAGFTYYSNVISFGGHTMLAAPALFGGYEYTPYEMNKRSDQALVEKHNEALTLMPTLFSQNGYQVTIADPPYANYQEIPDFSIYEELPNIQTYLTRGAFPDTVAKQRLIRDNERNFFCYSILKVIPLCMQERLYAHGSYLQGALKAENEALEVWQNRTSPFTAVGRNQDFMDPYYVLTKLPEITEVVSEDSNHFLLMTNDTAHDPMLLQKPDYTPALYVDNTAFENPEQYTVNGTSLKMETERQIITYHANMAAMLQLGKWFDYLREHDVYDNTRIILVSDHAVHDNPTHQLDDLVAQDYCDMSAFFPLLMVKDFASTEFTSSDEFMTNGDVPTLAMNGIIRDPINPFTGKAIDSSEKTSHMQYVTNSYEFSVLENRGNTFLPAKWYSVHDNIWEKGNWKVVAEDAVLPTVVTGD